MSRRVRCSMFFLLLAVEAGNLPSVEASQGPQSKAEAYAKEAAERLGQNKFAEAADNYQLAAKEAMKEPGGESKAKKYLANYNLYRAMGIYSQADLSGIFGRTDLDDAIQQADQARALFSEVQNPAGAQAAEGWRLYLSGIKSDGGQQFKEARDAYEKARKVFIDVGESVPAMKDTALQFARLAERGAIYSATMDLMWNVEEYGKRGGEINQLLASLQKRVSAEQKPLFEGLEFFSEGQRRFLEGSGRLESWDYSDAAMVLPKAEKALAEAAKRYAGLKEGYQRRTLQSTVTAWIEATKAEIHHGQALEALLDRGDMGRAKAEFISGVERYRDAKAAFEKAGFDATTIGAIQTRYTRLRDRAQIVSGVFGPIKAMLNVGRFFLVAFFGSLGVMTLLQRRLKLKGKQVLWISLVVAIIGAFGLKAPDFFNALKSFPKLG